MPSPAIKSHSFPAAKPFPVRHAVFPQPCEHTGLRTMGELCWINRTGSLWKSWQFRSTKCCTGQHRVLQCWWVAVVKCKALQNRWVSRRISGEQRQRALLALKRSVLSQQHCQFQGFALLSVLAS